MLTIQDIHSKKARQQKITMLTAYDYPTAMLEDQSGIDVILVGDSVGTNVLGYQDETEVTLQDIMHHVKAVRRGITRAYLLADMPYQTHVTPDMALANAQQLLASGASGVKVEGWQEKAEVIRTLTAHHIDVCGHIGFNPQTHGAKARVFGSGVAEAQHLLQSALAIEQAGAQMLVVEKVPEQLGTMITEALTMPVIGIGAGASCDGQVLVIHDILGLTPFNFKHAQKYLDYRTLTRQAIQDYKQDVESGTFPARQHSTRMRASELASVQAWLEKGVTS